MQELAQLFQVKIGDFVRANGCFEQFSGRFEKNTREQGLILRKDAIQDRQDLALAIADLLDQSKAEAGQLPHLKDHRGYSDWWQAD